MPKSRKVSFLWAVSTTAATSPPVESVATQPNELPVRKPKTPRYARDATARDAFAAVLDECLAQVFGNAIGLVEGDPAQRVEHVHQLRVGIRRLRSALRSFRGWVPAPADDLVEVLRVLFASLGTSRDGDVLDGGVVTELARVGAPPLALPVGTAGPDPAEAIRLADTQRGFLAWIAWQAALVEQVGDDSESAPADLQATAMPPPAESPPSFRHDAQRRLRRWHRRILAEWKLFDVLDETGLHRLRKRIKRQRYAVEFFAPALRPRQVKHYLAALTAVQEHMGALNDLFVARARYQLLVASEPAAWFALGWLAARVAEVRGRAGDALERLALVSPPGH